MARHREIGERLVVVDPEGAWFLWMGDAGVPEPIDIPERLARWVAAHPSMVALDAPSMWFDVASLPMGPATPVASGQPEHVPS